jgi:hypothetical protein
MNPIPDPTPYLDLFDLIDGERLTPTVDLGQWVKNPNTT